MDRAGSLQEAGFRLFVCAAVGTGENFCPDCMEKGAESGFCVQKRLTKCTVKNIMFSMSGYRDRRLPAPAFGLFRRGAAVRESCGEEYGIWH